jgi:hypothetical protein
MRGEYVQLRLEAVLQAGVPDQRPRRLPKQLCVAGRTMLIRAERDRRDELSGLGMVSGRGPRLLEPARLGARKRDRPIPA